MQHNNPVSNTPEQLISSDAHSAIKLHPTVAIGASAGGLEALSSLLDHLPPDLGLAYVVIQHLSQTHESILPELLQRRTTMPVHQVTDGMPIGQNQVYVIPPNTFMAIEAGKFTLSPLVKTDGNYYSIDYFMTSLASVYQHLAVGIVLSGTATDGTDGVRHIKAEGGITFAQDETAHFQGMPRSATESGFIDFTLSPEGIAKKLVEIVEKQQSVILQPEEASIHYTALKRIQDILHSKKSVDFSFYKQSTIQRRILRRMTLRGHRSLEEYTALILNDPAELELLYKDLLINVTSFFREAAVYRALSDTIFPALFKNREAGDPIRIWCPACATGEEASSIIICLFEYLKEAAINTRMQIFGTDLNEAAIEKARSGYYSQAALQHVSPQRLKRFFVKADGRYQIIKAIRDVCIFAQHNLLKDPPFSRMDLISCQNVMIYLESDPQKKILQSFHYGLNPSGYLILGKSESIGTATDLFAPINKGLKIYARKPNNNRNGNVDLLNKSFPQQKIPIISLPEETKKQDDTIDIDKETTRLLLSDFVPASIVINSDFYIFRFHGPIEKYLQPVSGKATLHLLKMVRNELVYELRSLVHQVKKESKPIRKEGFTLFSNGQKTEINIQVVPVKANSKEAYFLIVFEEKFGVPATEHETTPANKPAGYEQKLLLLEHEIRDAQVQMKNMTEEFEATRAELQSANEEILSNNEELQSINEELETSKEELQSTNEELTTINEELMVRNTDLKEAIDYSLAIVETIREPLILLTANLRIRTANKAFYHTFKLNLQDVEGRFLYEIDKNRWNVPELSARLSEVAGLKKGLATFELNGIFPNRVLLFNAMHLEAEDKKGDRVLLSIQDITLQRQAQQTKEWLAAVVDSSGEGIFSFSTNRIVISWNKGAEEIFGYTAKEMIGRNLSRLWPPDIKYQQMKQSEPLLRGETIRQYETTRVHKDGRLIDVSISAAPIKNEKGEIQGLVASVQDITERKVAQSALQESEERFRSIVSQTAVGIARTDLEGRLLFTNQKLCDLLGYTAPELIGKSIWELIAAEDLENKDLFRQLQNECIFVQFEKSIIHKNGNPFWVNINVTCIRDAHGKPQSATAVILDISKRRKAEDDLQRTKESLQVALEAADMGIWEMSVADNAATFHSPRHDQIFGYDAWQPVWTYNTARLHVLEADKYLFDEAFEEMYQTGGSLQLEFRVLWADGTVHWVHIVGRLFHDTAGKPTRAAGIVMDITERKNLELRKDEFLSIASHELKTPVTGIKAYAQILQAQFLEEKNPAPAEMLGKLDNQVNKLTYLINELLDITRIAEGRLLLYKEEFDMNELIRDTAKEMQDTIIKHTIIQEQQPVQMLMADKERIGQVITNLISNAIKYSPDADQVIIRTESNSEKITVSVQDFGIGMPENAQSKVFERFYRSINPKTTHHPGLGLGLFISSEIIKLHKGTMWMVSTENGGSVFSFSLPFNI